MSKKTHRGWYKFSPPKMAALIEQLLSRQEISRNDLSIVGVKSRDTFDKYVNFLRSGNLVEVDDTSIRPKLLLRDLWNNIKVGANDSLTRLKNPYNLWALAELLFAVPTFKRLYTHIEQHCSNTFDAQLPCPQNIRATYLAMGEAAALWCRIGRKKIYVTSAKPSLSEFVEIATESYYTLKDEKQTEWILTGEWLEYLAVNYFIHPAVTSKLTEITRDAGRLSVYTEGSTPDTRFDQHKVWALRVRENAVTFEHAYLYRGDYLFSGVSSVRIKIEKDQAQKGSINTLEKVGSIHLLS